MTNYAGTLITKPGVVFAEIPGTTTVTGVTIEIPGFSDPKGGPLLKRIFEYSDGCTLQLIKGPPIDRPYSIILEPNLLWGYTNIVDWVGIMAMAMSENTLGTVDQSGSLYLAAWTRNITGLVLNYSVGRDANGS